MAAKKAKSAKKKPAPEEFRSEALAQALEKQDIAAVALLAFGADPTTLLVLSQVVLSFGIAFAIVPLVVYTSRRSIMGADVNAMTTRVVAGVIALVIVALNVALVVLTVAG